MCRSGCKLFRRAFRVRQMMVMHNVMHHVPKTGVYHWAHHIPFNQAQQKQVSGFKNLYAGLFFIHSLIAAWWWEDMPYLGSWGLIDCEQVYQQGRQRHADHVGSPAFLFISVSSWQLFPLPWEMLRIIARHGWTTSQKRKAFFHQVSSWAMTSMVMS